MRESFLARQLLDVRPLSSPLSALQMTCTQAAPPACLDGGPLSSNRMWGAGELAPVGLHLCRPAVVALQLRMAGS